jgi:hypothetical protein
MDRQYIREHQVIERYLSGTLTADEEQGFEEAYLGDSELLDQLQAAERLRDGIKGLDSAGDLERSRPRWRQTFASPRYAMAATVLLAVSLGFSSVLYNENQVLRDGGSSTPLITRFVALESVRGAGDVTEISAPAQDELTVLMLDAGAVAYGTYRAVITRRDGEQSEQIWSRAGLTPELNGTTIAVSVQGRMLRPGTYEATLDGRMNDWPAERFAQVASMSFVVVPRD